MFIVVTGGIGSGKSTILKALKNHGDFSDASFLSIDTIVSNLYERASAGNLADLADVLMKEFNTLKKHEIASIVFADEEPETVEKRKLLENAFAPFILAEIETYKRVADERTWDLVLEFPTFFEKGGNIGQDLIISISAPEDVRLERALRRGDSKELVKKKMDAQISNLERKKLSDLTIVNVTISPEQAAEQIVHFVRQKKNPNYKHAVTAGSFDPITLGHAWMIKKSLMVCDHLTVLVANNSAKKHLLSLGERTKVVKETLEEYLTEDELEKISITTLDAKCTTVAAAKKLSAKLIIRGIRNQTDFSYENELSLVNRSIDDTIEPIYLIPPRELTEVSSSLVRNLMGLDGWEKLVSRYVSKSVLKLLKNVCIHKEIK